MCEPNYKKIGFKTKAEAIQHLISCLIENPGCGDENGQITVIVGGKFYTLKTVKKKKNAEAH